MTRCRPGFLEALRAGGAGRSHLCWLIGAWEITTGHLPHDITRAPAG
jgi:hypothetical protein